LSTAGRLALYAAAALALGALQSLAFVHTATLWWLPIAALAGLKLLLDGASVRGAALVAWCYGTGWLAAGVWWLFVSMHFYGQLSAPLAALAVLALSGFLALYLAAVGAAYARWRRGTGWHDALLLATLWLLAEMARGKLFTGFPWLASGYSQVDAPLAALAPWVGVYGMGFALALVAAVLAAVVASRARQWRGGAAAVAALSLLAITGPGEHTRAAGTLALTLIQPNVAQDEKFAAERLPAALAWLAEAMVTAKPGLVIAPETAIPLLPSQLDEAAPGLRERLQAHFSSPDRAALVGLPLGDFERGYTNSVLGWSARQPPYRYDKHHLVPFGEFNPPGFRWFVDLMGGIPLGDFARGAVAQPAFEFGGQRIGPNICDEDLFGEELARRFADDTSAPTLMANVSNIGWFGNTIAVPQHLAISRLRTLEFQRAMVRSTNTGATAIVNHRGQVQAALVPYTQGRLEGTVEGRSGLTPYARWAAPAGHTPLVLLAVAGLLVLVWRRRGSAA
jgi:apolipoprotein N-acyltransferase